MKQPASAEPAPAKEAQHQAPPARRPRMKKEQEIEDEPVRYASPPCYLAEFSGEDLAGQTSK